VVLEPAYPGAEVSGGDAVRHTGKKKKEGVEKKDHGLCGGDRGAKSTSTSARGYKNASRPQFGRVDCEERERPLAERFRDNTKTENAPRGVLRRKMSEEKTKHKKKKIDC